MTWYAVLILAVAAACVIVMAWGAQVREWVTEKALARLRRDDKPDGIDEDFEEREFGDGGRQ